MDRVAVFVDAGYLFAQGSKEISGRQLQRREISLDHQTLIRLLKDFAESVSGLPLLRIHWYDGTSQGPTSQHNTLADQADMKVRLGFVNSAGQQKGVDSLIVTDMISLARNRAMADCVLLSGDEDLRVGVQQAQEYGVRVHLLGIRPARGNQSLFLLREVDSSHEWNSGVLRTFLKCGPEGVELMDVDGRPESPAPAASHPTESVLPDTDGKSDHGQTLQQVARRVADDVPLADVPSLVEHIHATNQRPPEIDGRLLATSRNALGGNDLDSKQKYEVRAAFLDALAERLDRDSRKAAE